MSKEKKSEEAESVEVIKTSEEERADFIRKLKETSGVSKLTQLTVKSEEDVEYTCYLKKPNRGIMEQALGLMGKQGSPEMIRAGEVVLLGCWVDGDDIIKKDEDLLVSASLQAAAMLETLETSLKKV